MSTSRNLVNFSHVNKGFAAREILTDITLGIAQGDRIGVVGANGQGKSTLLNLIAGSEQPDSGVLTRLGSLRLGVLDQGDELDPEQTVREVLLGERAEHEWAADRVFRGVLDGLLGGVEFSRFAEGVETRVRALSGGERRRIALAQVLLDQPDLLLLDEPTNHLDVEVISWLAGHLAARSGAMLIVTHDRWFLDEVATSTWEVSDGAIHQYEGGYAAYVLARAERDRQASAREDKRRQLVRKELAWLRRGPPARTAKPKFRIEAANALIADEPPARDTTELLRFANSRLGNKVINAEDVSFAYAGRGVINDATWRLGPGDRLALVGANGSGKSTLMSLLAQELTPTAGRVERGETVKLAHLSQSATEIPEHLNVLEAVEEIRKRSTLADGSELTAGKLAERFGFRGEKARTPVADLSGGERRRLVLMRLLMSEPNVLLLDEPTNDLDIDTLTALEDLLDQWPGTLLVISHDRYFIERVCDSVFALTRGGAIRHVPGGVDQYIAELAGPPANAAAVGRRGPSITQPPKDGVNPGRPTTRGGRETREARKEAQRLERELERQTARERELHELIAASASDHARLSELTIELQSVSAERDRLETAWLEATYR
jgi:ATP-binding cassette subfamily F protein uup